jgi:hypothetical protein
MKLRPILNAVALALVLSAAAQCQTKKLNCTHADGSRGGRVIFNEAGGTASYNGIPEQNEPSSSATFTEREVKWDREVSGLYHHYFSLDRTTGDLLITRHTQKGTEIAGGEHCELAQQKY